MLVIGFNSRNLHQNRKSRNHNGFGIFPLLSTVCAVFAVPKSHLLLFDFRLNFRHKRGDSDTNSDTNSNTKKENREQRSAPCFFRYFLTSWLTAS